MNASGASWWVRMGGTLLVVGSVASLLLQGVGADLVMGISVLGLIALLIGWRNHR